MANRADHAPSMRRQRLPGLPRGCLRVRGPRFDIAAKARQLHAEGFSVRDVARMLGVAHRGMHRMLQTTL
jgi:hypothetical protein